MAVLPARQLPEVLPVENRAGYPHRTFEKGNRLHGYGVNLFLQYQLWVETQESTVLFLQA